MYSEIEAATYFLSNFLYDKIPRRKVNLFAEQLANFLVRRFQDHWDTQNPAKDSHYRCIQINVQGESEPLISVIATTIGVDWDEILGYLPAELQVWINPGEVCCRVGEHPSPVSLIYDSKNGPQQKAQSKLKLELKPLPQEHRVGGSGDVASCFEIVTPDDYQFTTSSFALTRFGTTRLKTDSGHLKQMQHKSRQNQMLPEIPMTQPRVPHAVLMESHKALQHKTSTVPARFSAACNTTNNF